MAGEGMSCEWVQGGCQRERALGERADAGTEGASCSHLRVPCPAACGTWGQFSSLTPPAVEPPSSLSFLLQLVLPPDTEDLSLSEPAEAEASPSPSTLRLTCSNGSGEGRRLTGPHFFMMAFCWQS